MMDVLTGPFDVVVLGASAGAHAAAITLLRGLPPEFSVPIVLMQHLAPESTGTAAMYQRGAPFAVEWLSADSTLTPHTVLVCPPRAFVELLPDGTFLLAPNERGAVEKPIDRLFASVARSFGHRAIGVVLTGMGADGAIGARQLHLAGGRVLVQSAASAEFPDMPKAAIEAGAADLVVPLADLGQVLGELVAGTPRPQARSELQAIRRAFGEQSEVAARAREVDWGLTALGPVISWPEHLRLLVRAVLDSPVMMAIWLGPELIQIYNDAWRTFLGAHKHPQALGGPARETWPELWPQLGPLVEGVLMRGDAAFAEEFLISIDRDGVPEEVFVSFAFSPLRDASGMTVGVQQTGWNVTTNVVAERRMRVLRELATKVAGATAPHQACERAAQALASNPADIPFALLYLLDDGRQQATLAAVTGAEAGSVVAPHLIHLRHTDAAWPLQRVLSGEAHQGGLLLSDLPERFPHLPAPPGSPPGTLPPRAAFLLPLRSAAGEPPGGLLVAGLSPHRLFDDGYRSFLDLLAQQINAGLSEARAKQLERERLDRLVELDRTKTEFFANVSHEFRTPLTLLLAPLEDLVRRREELPAELGDEVDVAASNARRLLRLVNSLLDFSQIETRRQQARFEPVDLCALTTDIASSFRSAIEAAGLRFHVWCDPELPPVWIDREMWEQVLANLLSNAFKFTFAGGIAVNVNALSLHAELVVRDTGIGIPQHELPHLFKRFHRVRGARARTAEGAGIGLAIVDDLIKRLGGQLRVRSTEGEGTEFTIWVPYKSARISAEPTAPAEPGRVHPFAGELARDAARWLAGAGGAPEAPAAVIDDLLGPPAAHGQARQGTILVADDNADMRVYLQRLLSPQWEVALAADGATALEAALRLRPDLLLADVMMPGFDGFELLTRVRAQPELAHLPVVLLTARAGEEAAIQGLLAGADDYIAKPFSPRELVARIQAAFERARAEQALRESEEKFRTLFDSIDEGFLIHEIVRDETGRATDLRLRDVNPAFTRQTGLGSDQVGNLSSEYLPNLERIWVDTLDRVARTGTPERFESFNQATDRWYNVHVSRAGRDDRRVAVVFEDITERKQWEHEVTRANELLQATFDNSLQIIQLFKAARDERGEIVDFEWLMTNKQWNDRWGEMAGKRLLTHNPAVIETGLFDDFKRVTETGVPITQEHYYAHEQFDGWFLQTVAKVEDGFLLSTLDITERKRAEEALRASEGKYRTLFDSIDEGLAIVEMVYGNNGEIVDMLFRQVNLAYERQGGVHNVVDRSIFAVLPGVEEHWLDIFRRVAKTGEAVRIENYQQDVGRWFDVYFARVDDDGRFVAIVFNDISERKRAEHVLRESEERQAFLLTFSDALRAEPDADSVANRAIQMLAEQLQLDRCWLSQVFEQQQISTVGPEHIRPDLPPMAGVFQLSDYPETMRQLATQPMVIHDAVNDGGFSDSEKALLAQLHLRALLVAPLRKGQQQVIWALAAAMATPRTWTEAERVLLEEVAERTWAATERARTEQAVRESEGRLRALVENLPGGAVFIVDQELRYRLAEGEALHAAGFEPREYLGKTIFEALPPELAASYEPVYRQALAGEAFMHEHTPHGRTYISRGTPLHTASGDVYAVLVVSYDITDRKQAEEALRHSEARFRTLADAVPQVIWTNDAAGRAIYFNQRWYDYSGLSEEQSAGLGWQAIVHPEDEAGSVERWQRALAAGEVFETEYRLRHAGGVYRWHLGRTVPLRDEGGAIIGWFGSATDIEALKQAEAARQESAILRRLAKAQEEERLRIARDLHDQLGQLVTGLLLQLKQLEEPARGTAVATLLPPAQALAVALAKEAHRIAMNLRPTALEDVGLVPALERLVADWSAQSGVSAAFQSQALGQRRLPQAVEVALFRIVQESLTNVHKHAVATRVSVTLQRRGEQVTLVVEDNGRGFDLEAPAADERPRLGVLGMRERVGQLGGTLEIETAPGSGTAVLARVPLDPAITAA